MMLLQQFVSLKEKKLKILKKYITEKQQNIWNIPNRALKYEDFYV